MFAPIVLISIICSIIYLCFRNEINEYSRVVHLIYKLPQASKIPFIGIALRLMTTKEGELLNYLQKIIGKNRLIAELLAGVPNVILTQPEDFEKILNSTVYIKKGLNYNTIMMWLNEGLLTSSGAKWRIRRKLLTPSFHFRILENCIPIMHKNADNLVNKLMEFGPKPSCVLTDITQCSLDIICETAMGIQINKADLRARQYCSDIVRISELIMKRELNVWLRSSLIFSASATGKEFNAIKARLHEFTTKVINERKKIFLDQVKNNMINEENEDNYNKNRQIFLDCLLEVEHRNPGTLTDSDIREEVDTFIFEGHDTTSTAVLFTLFNLGLHQHIQEKALEEQEKIFGNDRLRAPSRNDLQEMQYLERVIKETLRLYPSVPIFSRQINHDLHLDKDTVIPASTNVILIPYFLHRNPKYFEEPAKFDPDRFLTENMKKVHPYSYIPFSAGARNCIGQKFAMLELKTVVSTVLRRLEIRTVTNPEDLILAPLLILRSINPILLAFKPRKLY